MNILVSRTDNIGDVVLTLPLCRYLKEKFGVEAKIYFLGKTYTESIVRLCPFVDFFLNFDDLNKLTEKQLADEFETLKLNQVVHVFPNKKISKAARMAGVFTRIGTRRRLFHWFTCNKLPNLSRRNSQLHESQLNAALVANVYGWPVPSFVNLARDGLLEKISEQELNLVVKKLPIELKSIGALSKLVLLHPKSFGSAREWGVERFLELAQELSQKGFFVGLTGSEKEGTYISTYLRNSPLSSRVFLLAGLFSLNEFVCLIQNSLGLVAASTGPLHIAAASGVNALGLYPPMQPIHPARWRPLGSLSEVICLEKFCEDCRKTQICACLQNIQVSEVLNKIQLWPSKKHSINSI